MAQYYIDTSNFDASDWTANSEPASFFGINATEDAIELTVNGTSKTAYRYYAPAGSALEIEILALSRSPNTLSNNKIGLPGRIQNTASNNLYNSFVFQSDRLYLSYEINDSRSFPANTVSDSITSYTYHKFQITGTSPTTIRTKRWTGAIGDEPVAWDLSTTDSQSALQFSGFMGIAAFGGSTFSNYYKFIAFGTDGDSAPTSAVSGDSATTVGLESASEVGTPSAGQNHSLTTTGVESDSEVGTPSVGQNHSLSTNGVESASEVGNPAVGQNHSLTTTGIESASQVGTPTAGEVAGGDSAVTVGLESASETGTPSVGQNHVLSTNGLDSASEVGQPSVGQVHIVSTTGIESASTVGNPTALDISGLLTGINPTIAVENPEYDFTNDEISYTYQAVEPVYTYSITQ